VSDAVLLNILSNGQSDPNQVQDDFEKIFDAISRVEFDEQDRRLITAIKMVKGDVEEVVTLTEGVRAEGMIE
jgi:dynein heavy chain